MATQAKGNQVIVTSAIKDWTKDPAKLALRLQHIMRGNQLGTFVPEFSDSKRRWQLDSGDNWWLRIENGKVHVDSRLRTSVNTSQERWLALESIINWLLGDPPKLTMTRKDLIIVSPQPRWFHNAQQEQRLVKRVQDVVVDAVRSPRFSPVFKRDEDQWSIDSAGKWWLALDHGQLYVDYLDKDPVSPTQWLALQTFLQWRLE